MTDSSVSVVINTLNRCESLERTLVALREQTFQRFEVVVVNGPSTDQTAEMLQQFADDVRIVDCADAVLGISRNMGVAASAGDIVAFIDDDAIPARDWIEQLVGAYADDSVSAVGGPVFDVPLNTVDWEICTCTRLGLPNTQTPPPIRRYAGVGSDPFPYLAGCNMSFRRKDLQQVGGFNPLLSYGYDDVDICCRLNDAGHRIEYAQNALVRHYRAASAVRDERQLIRDPYPLIRSRVIFAMQCEYSSATKHEIVQVVPEWESEWIAYSLSHLAAGDFTAIQSQQFAVRARQGIIDGLELGARPRELVPIGSPPLGEFRAYQAARAS
ncbi:hypothetical protein BH10ACT2_BH10ACT2_00460 [soil metagenome]